MRLRRLISVLAVGSVAALGATLPTGSATAAPTAPTPAPSAQKAARANKYTIGTHNVEHGGPKSAYSGFANVIGWQEVDNAKSRANLKAALPGHRLWLPKNGKPGSFADPISYRKGLKVIAEGSVRTHKGETDVTPARFVNWIVLQNKKTGATFSFVNTHFISKAFTTKPERRARWNRHLRALKKVVRDLQPQPGPVFVVGDFNNPNTSSLPGMRALKAGKYDQLYVSTDAKPGKVQRLGKAGSDHHAFRAKVSW